MSDALGLAAGQEIELSQRAAPALAGVRPGVVVGDECVQQLFGVLELELGLGGRLIRVGTALVGRRAAGRGRQPVEGSSCELAEEGLNERAVALRRLV